MTDMNEVILKTDRRGRLRYTPEQKQALIEASGLSGPRFAACMASTTRLWCPGSRSADRPIRTIPPYTPSFLRSWRVGRQLIVPDSKAGLLVSITLPQPRGPYVRAYKKEPRPCFHGRGVYLATTYSHRTCRPTTIGAEAFHFRVRNGTGWFHLALVTRGQS
jgi:hypothetical protein